MQLFERYWQRFESTPGWFYPMAAATWDVLLDFQGRSGIEGDLLEIGVWKGKSAVLSAMHCRPGERAVLLDFRITEEARANLLEAAPDTECVFVESSSHAWSFTEAARQLEGRMRWCHIDGGHSAREVQQDLELAHRLVNRDGIVVLDDFFSSAYPQVAEAVFRYLFLHPRHFTMLLSGYNKAYLCRPEAGLRYREFLRDEFYTEMARRGCGDLTVWKTSTPDEVNAFGMSAQVDGLPYRGLDTDHASVPVDMPLQFSIIIPTRNRTPSLDRCLEAIGKLEYPQAQFEVLVVDDGSTVSLEEVFVKHADRLPLRTFRGEGRGPARARNLALREARGRYVVYTDDDCRPSSQWLKAYEEALQREPRAGFGGKIVDAPENGIFGRTSQMLVSFLYEYNETTDAIRFFCSNNLCFPRNELAALGGFDESFPLAAGEDRYLCWRWLREAPLKYVPDALIEHRQILDFRGYVRQQFRYGRGARQFWKRRQEGDGSVNKVQPLHFYSHMLTYPFGRVSFPRAVAMMLLLVLSQVAGALGYYSEKL